MGETNNAVEEYKSSLADLTFNSKPHINMLTMLAEENAQHASRIVQAVETHIMQVEASKKLAAVYLLDSIVKNLPETTNYKKFFAQNIVFVFVAVFEKVDEKTRQSLYKLRQTWNNIFPDRKLYALDVKVNQIDPAWPITAVPQDGVANIHLNPKFLKVGIELEANSRRSSGDEQSSFSPQSPEDDQKSLQQQLLQKQHELVRLQQERIQVELAAAKAKLEAQTKLLQHQSASGTVQKSFVVDSNQLAANQPDSVVHDKAKSLGENRGSSSPNSREERVKGTKRVRSDTGKVKQKSREKSPLSVKSLLKDDNQRPRKDNTHSFEAQDLKSFDIVGEIISQSLDEKQRISDSQFALPSAKRPRKDNRGDDRDYEDVEVDGRQQSYGSRASRSEPDLSSPSQNRWALFKAERPEDFPAPSPLLKTPPVSFDRRRAPLLNRGSRDSESTDSGESTLRNRLLDLVVQAEKDYQSGRLVRSEYSKLMDSMKNLLSLQSDENDSNVRSERPSLEREKGIMPGDPRGKRQPLSDRELLWNNNSAGGRGNTAPRGRGGVNKKNIARGQYGGSYYPAAEQPLLPDVPPPPKPPLLNFAPSRKPTSAGGQTGFLQPFYIPGEDERWSELTKQFQNEPRYEFVINDQAFGIGMVAPHTTRRIKFNARPIEVTIDPISGELFIDNKMVYRIGTPPREYYTGSKGRDRHIVYFHGPVKKIWFDQEEVVVRLDAPPQHVRFAGRDVEIQLDSKLDTVFADGEALCPLSQRSNLVTMWGEEHEVAFCPPMKDILINGELCTLDRSQPYPIILIKGEWRGIRFKGPDREVRINGQLFMVPTCGVKTAKLPGARPFRLALGGPGHELIIDDMWYEIKFAGVPRTLAIGTRILHIVLSPPPPEVEILGIVQTAMADGQYVGLLGAGAGEVQRPALLPEPTKVPLLMWPPEDEQFANESQSMLPDSRSNVGVTPNGMRHVHSTPSLGVDFSMSPSSQHYQTDYRQAAMSDLVVPQAMYSEVSDVQPSFSQYSRQQASQELYAGNVPSLPPAPQQSASGLWSDAGGQFVSQVQPLQSGLLDSSAPIGQASSQSTVNVHDLLAKLVKQGLIGQQGSESKDATATAAVVSVPSSMELPATSAEQTPNEVKEESAPDEEELQELIPSDVPDLTDFKMEKLRGKYAGCFQSLYTGMPCATCGIRFRRQTDQEKYREHLDWHFRQNKRGKDEMKIAKFRHWYYSIEEWVQYEEIGDLEEKARSQFFETMLASVQQQLQQSYTMSAGSQVVSNCRAAEGEDTSSCAICGEQFEQFWDEEEDEWLLRDAVRIDGKIYHPVCYEDAKENSQNEPYFDEDKDDDFVPDRKPFSIAGGVVAAPMRMAEDTDESMATVRTAAVVEPPCMVAELQTDDGMDTVDELTSSRPVPIVVQPEMEVTHNIAAVCTAVVDNSGNVELSNDSVMNGMSECLQVGIKVETPVGEVLLKIEPAEPRAENATLNT